MDIGTELGNNTVLLMCKLVARALLVIASELAVVLTKLAIYIISICTSSLSKTIWKRFLALSVITFVQNFKSIKLNIF